MVRRKFCRDQIIERVFWFIFPNGIEYVISSTQCDTSQEDNEPVWIVVVVHRSKREKRHDDEHHRSDDQSRLTITIVFVVQMMIVVVCVVNRSR